MNESEKEKTDLEKKRKQREYSIKHYLKNRQRLLENAAKDKIRRKKEARLYLNSYLSTHSCIDCKESNIIVLEFDHVRGEKRANVTDLMRLGCSLVNLQKEIDKCDVRCANCHRKITHKRRLKKENLQLMS